MRKQFKILLGIIIWLALSNMGVAQQNHSIFFMHYLPESNLLNPAIPIPCKWYIGIPILSSVHLNYANTSFSYKNVFTSTGNGSYEANIDNAVKGLKRRNYLGTEFHTQLLAIGHRRGEYSFQFTITEKDNLPITYPKEVILLAWDGNTQFKGEEVGFKGTGNYFNHYREYALSASKQSKGGVYYGIRAKLLFGKLNISTRKADISMYTDENTFNLEFNGDIKINSSLPINIEQNGNSVGNVTLDESISPISLALNRKNPGFAFDFGIIFPLNDKMEFSASVIDLGLIRWRSNLNTLIGSGEFTYSGIDTIPSESYFDNIQEVFTDSMDVNVSHEKYTTALPPRLIAGLSYIVSPKLKAGIQAEVFIYRTKIMPSVTFSGNYNLFRNTYLMASYTIQYNTFRNLGLGFVMGRGPVQFYMISDNAAGFIWPMSTRNINLRFGLNINLGCHIRTKEDPGKGALKGNCYYLEKSIQKNYRKKIKKK